jgi:holo-[acyl-carrier protein] synthase
MIIGTGVDIVEIKRFRGAMERSGEKFVLRLFTPDEQQYCNSHRDPVPHFAARFAAKESVFKALGTGWAKGVTWLDVEVQKEEQEAPRIVLHGEAERLCTVKGIRNIHLSLSHSDHSVVAMVILEK